jgi:anthranilate synthase component 1
MKLRSERRRVALGSSPVAFFEAAYGHDNWGFIYESLEKVGTRGRYSYVGGRPLAIFQSKGRTIEIRDGRVSRLRGDPFAHLRRYLEDFSGYPTGGPFPGGAVGYIAYDMVRFFENIPDKNPAAVDVPDAIFIFPSEITIFDYHLQTVDILVYNGAPGRANELAALIARPVVTDRTRFRDDRSPFRANLTRLEFCGMVEQAKEHIRAGDIFQVVLSQRFELATRKEPLNVYRALRVTNPSPYMYYLKLGDLAVAGSSPETLVKLQNGIVTSRPIAGTRPRGRTRVEDHQREADLLADEKERAEHVMLVDLARSDIGRICRYGSVRVTEFMKPDRYSRVMHLTSNVVGRLRKGLGAFDVLPATFPAGTVSGAPKIRAMEIIDDLEPEKRGIYAGAIGYFGFNGDMDFCITIRTIVQKDETCFIQAGAGIVADSRPQREYAETLHKASALKRAIEIAP